MPSASSVRAIPQVRAGGEAAALVRLSVRERIIDAVPADLRDEWTALADHASEPNAFAEPWFVGPSLAHLRDEKVRLLEVRDQDRLIGVAMFGVERGYARLPLAYVQNWRHHHVFLGAPLVAAGREADYWRALLDHLDAARWAPNFLHLHGLVEDGPLLAALRATGRSCAVVHREIRAALASDLSPTAYYETVVRKKKRKELARLRNRLAELGALTTRRLTPEDDLTPWCDAFLRLEADGWKGKEGSALACTPATEAFFREAVAGARAAGRLELLALELDGRPIAMLVNFVTPPGSFSFKTTFDEAYARFSPGVLLQIENLDILDDPRIAWMDSCASADHPMIDSLWAERRAIVRVTVPLKGLRRRLAHDTVRGLETLSSTLRRTRPRNDGETA